MEKEESSQVARLRKNKKLVSEPTDEQMKNLSLIEDLDELLSNLDASDGDCVPAQLTFLD
ncbi:MAG TPA: hypothetical protein PLD95_04625 [bacterium]|jgi:type III secretory pathway lipoprotein EscJ|nr:hypothetical protein [bacterium]HOG38720.1 hypothetical protein [bacterium]